MKRRVPPLTRDEMEAWYTQVRESMPPLRSSQPDLEWPVDLHHVVTAQSLARHEKRLGLEPGTLVYDPLLSVPVTRRRHERIHSYHESVRPEELPAATQARLAELGLEPTLSGW